MTSLVPSRAENLLAQNTTPKKLAAQTKRSLTSIRASIEKLAQPYEDIDNSVAGAQQVLLAAFDEFEKTIDETVQWLLECPE